MCDSDCTIDLNTEYIEKQLSSKNYKVYFQFSWPFEANHTANVALGENEFDTPIVDACPSAFIKILQFAWHRSALSSPD